MATNRELQLASEAEAERVSLPSYWHYGLTERAGLCIDNSYVPDRDDAISATHTAQEGYTLHVSISDVGRFLYDKRHIVRYAGRVMRTLYYGEQVVSPMLPKSISEDMLSLSGEACKPVLTAHIPIQRRAMLEAVTFTHEKLYPTSYTPEEADRLLRNPDAPEHIKHLRHVAAILQADRSKRQGMASDEATDASTYGGHLAGNANPLVEGSNVTANAGAATFADREGLTVPYRTYQHDPESRFNMAQYSLEPGPHDMLGQPEYMHFSAPLRRFVDFMGHCNIVAHLDGREQPFSEREVRFFIDKINAVTRQRMIHLRSIDGAPIPYADQTMRWMQDDTIRPRALAYALFRKTKGPGSLTDEASMLAAHYVAEHPTVGEPVINTALQKGWLQADKPTEGGRVIGYADANVTGNQPAYKTIELHAKDHQRVAKIAGFLHDIVHGNTRLAKA